MMTRRLVCAAVVDTAALSRIFFLTFDFAIFWCGFGLGIYRPTRASGLHSAGVKSGCRCVTPGPPTKRSKGEKRSGGRGEAWI